MTWDENMQAMNTMFNEQAYEDPMPDLTNLLQWGSVKEYIDQFEALVNGVSISQAYSISIFPKGLRCEIQHVVRMLQPQKLHAAYVLARMQEATSTSYYNPSVCVTSYRRIIPRNVKTLAITSGNSTMNPPKTPY